MLWVSPKASVSRRFPNGPWPSSLTVGRWSFACALGVSVHVVPAVPGAVRFAFGECGGTQTRAGGVPELLDDGVLCLLRAFSFVVLGLSECVRRDAPTRDPSLGVEALWGERPIDRMCQQRMLIG